ncbi:pentatricopeptide repeat-containing protein At4g02750-like [Sesamum indicum]|uniref:Pentatricopeptide repeat-containing protein At4g02750-like n=1 Tax=Sesamum indicum TaxID=4182 RepID=A0A6I9SQ51_SESIN|nr:pentatricopeptide repeat-containing protein At4g02750-like [Sesamum indicum]
MIGGRSSWKLHLTVQNNIPVLWTCISFLCNENRRTLQELYTTSATATSNSKSSILSRSRFSSLSEKKDDSVACLSFSSTYDYNVRMGELGRRGNVSAACKLFESMPERDKVSYASMISIYLKNEEFQKAERLYYEIPDGMSSIVADSAMVHAYAKVGRMDRAREIFDEMPERNAFSWTSLISGYFKLGRVGEALKLFGEMPESQKNEITWTNVVLGLGRNGLIDEARSAFDLMPVKNVVAWTSMIKAYVENDLVDEALKLFHEMPQYNLYSWNIIIYGLLDESRVNEAKELFDSMPWRNTVSWTTMVTGLARNGMVELARRYFDQMPNKDVSAWNAMITAYTDVGRMGEASELFKLMSGRNIVTWNAMIDGYAKDRQEDEAFRHFIWMLHSCIRPNETSLTSVLTSCRGMVGVLQVHGLVVHLGFEKERAMANTLITMYYRSGDVTSARTAFDSLEAKDVVTWTAMILAYSNHGFGLQALQAFAKMLRSGHTPDEITLVGVLSACSHAGLVKKGQMIFDSMTTYGLEPMPEHYSCLVDILGRAGLVNEAMKVVREMPPDKYDGAVLGALLGACRLHGNEGLVDHIGDELIALEPASSGGYVLLANVYAASGKWDKFSELRKKMKEREVKKVPGFSQIEVNGKSHVFLVGDRSHSEMKEIYMLLHEKLLPQMQDIGHEIANIPAVL